MDDLRIPMEEFVAEVVCADGRRFTGRVFVPKGALTHEGPMRADEWINSPEQFFPFLEEGLTRPFLLNKGQIAVLNVSASADSGGVAEEAPAPERRVEVEVAGMQIRGTVSIEMPEGHERTVDFMNQPEAFVTVREGERHHLVRKRRITRIVEIREE